MDAAWCALSVLLRVPTAEPVTTKMTDPKQTCSEPGTTMRLLVFPRVATSSKGVAE